MSEMEASAQAITCLPELGERWPRFGYAGGVRELRSGGGG